MATALDLLMSTQEDVNLLSEESDICTIDPKTRVIFVPSTIVVGGGCNLIKMQNALSSLALKS